MKRFIATPTLTLPNQGGGKKVTLIGKLPRQDAAKSFMNATRQSALVLAGFSLALLFLGCSQEPANSPSPAPPPPPAQSPPQVEPPPQVKPGPVSEQVLKVVRDPSGRHYARVVQREDKQVVIRDGKPGPEYDQVGEVAFSAGGESLAYEAQRGNQHLMVLDDREWPLKAEVVQESFQVSPDNKRLALVTWHQDKWQVMVDGRPDPPFDFIFIETLKFSPNSSHIGYLALKGSKLAAVVDGKPKGQWDILNLGAKPLEDLLSRADDADAAKKGEEKKE